MPYISKENPPTIRSMAARCNISVGTVVNIIRDVIHARCLKKDQYTSSIQLLLRREVVLGVCILDYAMKNIKTM